MSPAALSLDPEAFRRLAHRAADLAADYLAGLHDRGVFRPMAPAERQAFLDLPMPGRGVPPEALLDFVRDRVMAHPMGHGHPRFFGWVNSPPSPVGVVADLLAAVMNPSCAGGDHAAIYLERAATRALMELVGFPVAGSMGLLVSGGSMASLTALAAARHLAARQDGWDVRADGLQGGRPPLVLYVSEEGHGCLRKAAELLGLGAAHVRTVPVDADFRMDVGALDAALPPARPPAGGPSASPRAPARSTPARSTRSIAWPTSARRAGSGCTSTARTARWGASIPRSRRDTPGSSGPTRSPSTLTSGSRYRLSAGRSSSATARSCAMRSAWCRRISGPRRGRASAGSRGSRSTASSRRAASGRSSSG